MKRIGILASVILLSTLVLLGSGSFTVGKMICGGEECAVTAYSLGKAKDCCDTGNDTDGSFSKSCCCKLINVSYSLDEFSVSEKINVSAQEFDFFFSPSVFVFHLPSAFLLLPLSDPPSPDAQNYLHFIGSLLL